MTGRIAALRFISAALVGGMSLPAAAQLSHEQILSSPAQQVEPSATFQFGRTRYFSALVLAHGCDGQYLDRVSADQKAFREISGRLRAVFKRGFDPFLPVDPASITAAPCSESSIGSFEMKIAELRSWADRAEQLGKPARP